MTNTNMTTAYADAVTQAEKSVLKGFEAADGWMVKLRSDLPGQQYDAVKSNSGFAVRDTARVLAHKGDTIVVIFGKGVDEKKQKFASNLLELVAPGPKLKARLLAKAAA